MLLGILSLLLSLLFLVVLFAIVAPEHFIKIVPEKYLEKVNPYLAKIASFDLSKKSKFTIIVGFISFAFFAIALHLLEI